MSTHEKNRPCFWIEQLSRKPQNDRIAVKVFGEDQDQLRKLAESIRAAMSNIRGVEDLAVEQVAGEEHLEVDVERD